MLNINKKKLFITIPAFGFLQFWILNKFKNFYNKLVKFLSIFDLKFKKKTDKNYKKHG